MSFSLAHTSCQRIWEPPLPVTLLHNKYEVNEDAIVFVTLAWFLQLLQATPMPKKARDNTSKKARGKERGRTNEQGPKKKGRDAPTSRYGSLCGFSDVVDVLFRKWHARNVRSLPCLCSMDQQLLASLEDLKQNVLGIFVLFSKMLMAHVGALHA
ncbi:hypothetical protein PIB30_037836 [Stylosanthes scabra]|uniref:Uncharacterized protein n=1 Tax=Stylosanthes scabra TaxID=79078 RepID=A0ABU6SDR6_9FABA|nr:hypothetical protein [Stylosanthes scabra]